MSTVAERVAAGAAFLDEHDPGWWRADVERAIDLETLALQSEDMCILGQRCPVESAGSGYIAYASRLSEISEHYPFAIDEWAIPLGFMRDWKVIDGEGEWDALTAEWKRVITERRDDL